MGPEGMRQGKRDKKKGEEHQSKQGMKTGREWEVRQKYVKLRGNDE